MKRCIAVLICFYIMEFYDMHAMQPCSSEYSLHDSKSDTLVHTALYVYFKGLWEKLSTRVTFTTIKEVMGDLFQFPYVVVDLSVRRVDGAVTHQNRTPEINALRYRNYHAFYKGKTDHVLGKKLSFFSPIIRFLDTLKQSVGTSFIHKCNVGTCYLHNTQGREELWFFLEAINKFASTIIPRFFTQVTGEKFEGGYGQDDFRDKIAELISSLSPDRVYHPSMV